jgi:hypothetical protein
MPIQIPRRLVLRRQIAWLGVQPPDDARRAFEDRGYLVNQCTDENLFDPSFLSGLSAVVFTQLPEQPLQVAQQIEKHAHHLLNYDCSLIFRPGSQDLSQRPHVFTSAAINLRLWTTGFADDEAAKLKWQVPDTLISPPHATFFDFAVTWVQVANMVTAIPTGPAPNRVLTISVDDVVRALDPESEVMVRRAFWDCSDVHLVAMDGGRSGVRVFRAYAELAEGIYGQHPQPYFVKIGDRAKIFAEYKMYEEKVDPYIPFHLGPHLVRDRCCLGAKVGIIVGDFVEESENLCGCASEGRAATAIACLFDRTLLGWYRSATKVSTPICTGLLQNFPRPRKISINRLARARALGATHDLDELRSLFLRCDSQPVLVGPIHGDLHAANVRVRATDAIVIDFCTHPNFPLVYDAACLEASLLVEGFADDKREIQEWLSSVSSLYDNPLLDGTLPYPNPKGRSCWFHVCVRQIRRYARQWECQEHQYASALAVALLRKAVKDKDAPEPESSRRAVAYVLAERVLLAISSSSLAPAPAASGVK